MSLLDPRVWIAVLLAGLATFGAGYWKGDVAGKASTQAAWNKQKLAQAEQEKRNELDNRKTEFLRSERVINAQNAAAVRNSGLLAIATSARNESFGLQRDLATLRLQLPRLTREAVDQYAATATVVFDQCQRSYQELAVKADGHASDALMLSEAWPVK